MKDTDEKLKRGMFELGKKAIKNHNDTGNVISTTKVINVPDELVGRIDLVECCKIGPITNENYCAKCGAKIERT